MYRLLLRMIFDYESCSANSGELLLTPRLMPYKWAVKAFVGIVHTIFKLRYCRLQSRSAFKIQTFDDDVARTFFVTEKIVWSGGDYASVMLRYNESEYWKMWAVVESDSIFTVVNIKVVRNNVLAKNESVLPFALPRNSQHPHPMYSPGPGTRDIRRHPRFDLRYLRPSSKT